MTMQHAEVGRTYRWRMRDVWITQRSPLAPGGHEVHWEAVDGGPPLSGSTSEHIFRGEAKSLVGLDEAIRLGDLATTLRARFATGEATTFRSCGKALDGPVPTLHHATIWSKGYEPVSVPISPEDYRALGGVTSG